MRCNGRRFGREDRRFFCYSLPYFWLIHGYDVDDIYDITKMSSLNYCIYDVLLYEANLRSSTFDGTLY